MQRSSTHNGRRRLLHYGLAVAAALGAIVLRLLLSPVVADQIPFLLFSPAIVISSLYGGLGPGVVATALTAVLAAYFLLAPLSSLAIADPRQQVSLALFVIQGILLSALTSAWRTARQRAEADLIKRKQAEERLSVQYAISRVLAETTHFEAAVPHMLEAVGKGLGWQLGQFWRAGDGADVLHCTASWHTPALGARGVAAFDAASRELELAPGVELPGEVWQRGTPHWLPHLQVEPELERRTRTAHLDLRSAFAFPIHSSNGLIGIMAFFSTEHRAPDADLLATTTTIAGHISQFFERQRAEEAVRASEERKGAILAAALDAVITIDDAGRVTEWNRAAEAIFGYPSTEALGRLLADLVIPPSLRTAHQRGLAHYLATGEGVLLGKRVEVDAVRVDGTEFPAELSITRLPTNGAPLFTGFVRDLTARRQAEEAIRFQAQLLDTVEEAVIATDTGGTIIYWNHFAETLYGWPRPEAVGRNILDVTPAPTSLQGLEAAVRARDEFLSIAAHELKTPVTAILGYTQVLERRLVPAHTVSERDQRAVQTVVEQTQRLSRLVNMLLDVARLEIGQLALDRRRLDLGRLAHRIVDEVRPALVRHSIACETSQSAVIVEGDELRLIQVLQNLISNAVKYSPDGGAIRVCVASNDGLASMTVSDEGIGIPHEVQPRLFQRFFRAGNFATGNISGLGIGLYIVKEIVERHNGTVAVSSVEGEGSTFSVQLPLAVETPSP